MDSSLKIIFYAYSTHCAVDGCNTMELHGSNWRTSSLLMFHLHTPSSHILGPLQESGLFHISLNT